MHGASTSSPPISDSISLAQRVLADHAVERLGTPPGPATSM